MKKRVLAVLTVLCILLSCCSVVLAEPYVRSIEQDGLPKIVSIEVIDAYGNSVTFPESEDGHWADLIITPISKADEADIRNAEWVNVQRPKIKALLEHALDEIQNNTGEYGKLTQDIIEEFEYQKALSDDPAVKNAKAEDLTVIDIFDVSVVGEREWFFQKHGGSITVKIEMQPDVFLKDIFIIAHNLATYESSTGTWAGTENWEVLNKHKNNINLVDNTVTFQLNNLSVVAFIVDKNIDGKKSPNTQASTPIWMLIAAGVCACAAAGCFIVYARKGHDER